MKINTKKIIVFVVVLLTIAAGIMWFFVGRDSTVDEEGNSQRNLFPFGEILQGTGFGGSSNQGTTDNGQQEGQVTEQETDNQQTTPQLQRISDEPTGGMTSLVRIEETQVQSQVVTQDDTVEQVTETIEVENQFVRYGLIEDGSIYETILTGDRPLTEELIVENFIPNAERISFSKSGTTVSFQYWNNEDMAIETYLGLIEPIVILPEVCPFIFNVDVTAGNESEEVYDLHRFLNRDQRTYVAQSGINSPGNESTMVSELTIAAVEKFQTLYELTPDGELGASTQGEMQRVCNEQQQERADQEYEDLDTKFEISGFFLPQDIVSINMDPQEQVIFYLQEVSGAIRGTLQSLSDQTLTTIFSSPFTQWTSMWNNDGRIEITTKPSYASEGFSYDLEVENGNFHKSFKQRKGLTVIPDHSGERLLVHHVDIGRPKLSIYERSTNRFLPLNIETFTDKCVWTDDDEFIYCGVPDALAYGDEYPDVWYQGLETYNDSIWRVNTLTLQEELLSDLSTEYDESIDIKEIMIDPTNQYLYMIDKNTEFLWSYRINEV